MDSNTAAVVSTGLKILTDAGPVAMDVLTGNIVGAVSDGLKAVVTDAVAPLAGSLTVAHGAAGQALQLAQDAAAAVAKVQSAQDMPAAVGGVLEQRVAQLEAKAASWESAHPWVATIARVFGQMFPHELSGLGPMIAPPAAEPAAQTTGSNG